MRTLNGDCVMHRETKIGTVKISNIEVEDFEWIEYVPYSFSNDEYYSDEKEVKMDIIELCKLAGIEYKDTSSEKDVVVLDFECVDSKFLN